jgi:hypothetical protein
MPPFSFFERSCKFSRTLSDASIPLLFRSLRFDNSHDWPDKEATKILENLRNAATPKTKLVIIESALEPLSVPAPFPPADPLPYYLDLQSESHLSLISLFLRNGGIARVIVLTKLTSLSNLLVMCALNAQERTEAQYSALGEKVGWKLVKTWKTGEDGQDGPFRHYEFHVV